VTTMRPSSANKAIEETVSLTVRATQSFSPDVDELLNFIKRTLSWHKTVSKTVRVFGLWVDCHEVQPGGLQLCFRRGLCLTRDRIDSYGKTHVILAWPVCPETKRKVALVLSLVSGVAA
jgi:hypothetical protein